MAEDPGELADRLEHEADDMEERSEELHQRVEDTRRDAERQLSETGIPGAAEAETEPGSGSDDPGVAADS